VAIGAAMDSRAVLPIDVWVRRWSSTKDLCAVLKAQGTDGVFPCEDVMLLLSVVHKQRACFFMRQTGIDGAIKGEVCEKP
jgi:hypothetical protein